MRESGYYWVKFASKPNSSWYIALWDYTHWVLTGDEDSYTDEQLGGEIDEKQIKRE